MTLGPKSWQRRVSALGRAALSKAALERAEAYRLHIEWAFRQPGMYGRPISRRAAANKLNERNIESPMGGRWCGEQILRMAFRLGLNPPRARLPRELARAQVPAALKQHPHFTAQQMKESLGPEFPLGETRIWKGIVRSNGGKDGGFCIPGAVDDKRLASTTQERRLPDGRIRAVYPQADVALH